MAEFLHIYTLWWGTGEYIKISNDLLIRRGKWKGTWENIPLKEKNQNSTYMHHDTKYVHRKT